MGDIDFEEQLELERLEKERLEKEGDHPKEKVDPDGTVYEWDAGKKAWFPKVDANFIAQYQMNYGVQSGSGEGVTEEQKQAEYYNYYQNYYAAQVQQEMVLNKKKTVTKEDTTEEVFGKLEDLESNLQGSDSTDQFSEHQSDSKEDMEKYTEEQKKAYNDYWSYYYGTDYHDYYGDCMAQFNQQTTAQAVTDGDAEKEKDGKKKKKRKAPVQEKRDEGWFQMEDKDNTNVYVSGLPTDITTEEFKEIMTKYGLVMHDPRTKQPKLKLYFDENGQPKGDGRCCYIKKESVDLALKLLDGSELRGSTIKVEMAQFSMKGEYDPSKKKKKLTNKEKKKLKERQEKLFDWRPERPMGGRQKHEKVVILKNIFDPKDFEDDPTKINTLRNEMRTECAKYGDVKKIVVYDRHLDGVVSVHYKEAEEADTCVQNLHQRWFAQRRVLAETWDGKTKYEVLETEEEREARLRKWEKYLETGERTSEANPSSSTSVSVSADRARDSQNSDRGEVTSTATDSLSKDTVSEQDSLEQDKSAATSGASANLGTETVSMIESTSNTAESGGDRNPIETGTSNSSECKVGETSSAVNTNGVDQSTDSNSQDREDNDMESEEVNR